MIYLPVETWRIWRDGNSEDTGEDGELVTVYHFTKTGADTYHYGTFDEKVTTYTNVSCILAEKQIQSVTEPEGRLQIKYYVGLFKYDQTLDEGDVIARADGTKLYVVDTYTLRTGGTLSVRYSRLSTELVPHGQE